MKYRKRTFYTDEQTALMWDRWQRGDSITEIASLFDRHHSSVRGIFERRGGIRPSARCRSARSLTLGEREEIFRGLVAEQSLRSIAARLGRAPSTVSREVKRNGGRDGYSIGAADEAAWDRALRPKVCKLVRHRVLARNVAGKLKLQWSPEEIAGWLRREYPDDESRQVSHETIYKTLFVQARGALKKELLAHLRQMRVMRKPRGHTLKGKKQGGIVDAVSIRERPGHKRFSLATDVKVYFCDPQSPWQRGSNEQINGLLRQYFPKGMDLSKVNQNHVNAIARRLNERPRKTLKYYSPAEKLAECVASIG